MTTTPAAISVKGAQGGGTEVQDVDDANEGPDIPITGADLDRASAVALGFTGEGRVTRIVPTLAPGTPVTVPHTYVDYVVTEFGAAELRGKTVQERARALSEIAHPDFRDTLRDSARELYGA